MKCPSVSAFTKLRDQLATDWKLKKNKKQKTKPSIFTIDWEAFHCSENWLLWQLLESFLPFVFIYRFPFCLTSLSAFSFSLPCCCCWTKRKSWGLSFSGLFSHERTFPTLNFGELDVLVGYTRKLPDFFSQFLVFILNSMAKVIVQKSSSPGFVFFFFNFLFCIGV